MNRLSVSLKGPQDEVEKALGKIDGVMNVQFQPTSEKAEETFFIETDASHDLREDVFHLAVKKKWNILAMKQERLHLEEIFRVLTKEVG